MAMMEPTAFAPPIMDDAFLAPRTEVRYERGHDGIHQAAAQPEEHARGQQELEVGGKRAADAADDEQDLPDA